MSEGSVQHPPQSMAQAGARVAEGLLFGFEGSPSLLLIVVLNVAMILTGGYYMLQQDQHRNEVVKEVILLVKACILETSPLERERIMQGEERPQP